VFYIFEMANNHQGSVEHAKKIVDSFSDLAKKHDIKAAVKLQFRQLDTFIHNDFKKSDLKFVKRFNETRLTKEEFKEIIDYTESKGLVSMATPFDNESIPWLDDLSVSVLKVASCSIDDWVLLKELATINKKIIISTGGASMETLKSVYELFRHNKRDFVFMHCIGEYPTPHGNSNLKRIGQLRKLFPEIEIGISTHESPDADSVVPLAVAMGCSVIEKHVGVETDSISLNGYSNTPEQMEKTIEKIKWAQESIHGESKKEKAALLSLKRGVYAKRNIAKGETLSEDDFYFAMPVQEGQLNVSDINKLVGAQAPVSMEVGEMVSSNVIRDKEKSKKVSKIISASKEILNRANIALSGTEKAEISCHFGLDKFSSIGALIIDKVNREYCKKLIVMTPSQGHPTHHHIQKEEAFELLTGDCTLVLENREIKMKKGKPVVIARGIKHSFSTSEGCVIEEISTTHIPGDSVYEDPTINSLKLEERKIKVKL